MIKWRHPSSAPKDTSYLAGVDEEGTLEVWIFDPQWGHWLVRSIPGGGQRVCLTTSGMVGWARWSEVFDHIRTTAQEADND